MSGRASISPGLARAGRRTRTGETAVEAIGQVPAALVAKQPPVDAEREGAVRGRRARDRQVQLLESALPRHRVPELADLGGEQNHAVVGRVRGVRIAMLLRGATHAVLTQVIIDWNGFSFRGARSRPPTHRLDSRGTDTCRAPGARRGNRCIEWSYMAVAQTSKV